MENTKIKKFETIDGIDSDDRCIKITRDKNGWIIEALKPCKLFVGNGTVRVDGEEGTRVLIGPGDTVRPHFESKYDEKTKLS